MERTRFAPGCRIAIHNVPDSAQVNARLAFMSKLRIAGVIPARLGSTRLPRKVLREIAGRPMVEWVWRAAAGSGLMDPIVVATDSDEVAEVCRERGVLVAMTSPNC